MIEFYLDTEILGIIGFFLLLGLVILIVRVIKSMRPDAVFIGYQESVDGSSFPLFNVIRGPYKDSTRSDKGLLELGLRVPKYPEREVVVVPTYVPCDTDCINRDECSLPCRGSVEAVNCGSLEYMEEEMKEMKKVEFTIPFFTPKQLIDDAVTKLSTLKHASITLKSIDNRVRATDPKYVLEIEYRDIEDSNNQYAFDLGVAVGIYLSMDRWYQLYEGK